jgi:hypothetical protein
MSLKLIVGVSMAVCTIVMYAGQLDKGPSVHPHRAAGGRGSNPCIFPCSQGAVSGGKPEVPHGSQNTKADQ